MNTRTLRDLIADDAYAASFQNLKQYRQALLAYIYTQGATPALDERAGFSKFAKKQGYSNANSMYPTAWRAWQARAALSSPPTLDALAERAIGRAEALAIVLGLDPEAQFEDCVLSEFCGGSGEYNYYWDEAKLKEIFRADDSVWSLKTSAEYEYLHNLQLREEAEMLPSNPHVSAVRDAALEEAAACIESFVTAQTGMPDRHALAIRALKSNAAREKL